MRAQNHRDPGQRTTAILVAVSLGLHAILAVVVGNWATRFTETLSSSATAEEPEAMVVPFAYACTVDIGAMTAARLLYCSSPVADESCTDEALGGFETELILCEMQKPDMPAVSVAPPAEVRLMDAAAVAAIKPKPLLPMVSPKDPQEVAKKEAEKIEKKAEEEQKQAMRAAASAQIVEITKPELEMRPDKARFVSEFDSKVEKEKVARASTDKMVARPGAKETPKPQEVDDTPKVLRPQEMKQTEGKLGAKAGKKGRAGLLAMRGQKARASRLERLSQGLLSGARPSDLDGSDPIRGEGTARSAQKPRAGANGGQGGEGGEGGARVPNLRPSRDMLQKMVGGGSVDKLDGVEQGIETALNSRRWKYASFFNRMKRQVAQNWHPAQVYMRRDPTGRVYGSKDRLTVLKVSLTATGALANVIITDGSGVKFLDNEAVRAFRAAQPFPNPPGALLDKATQQITFSFGFHFQIDGPNDAWWKFKRY